MALIGRNLHLGQKGATLLSTKQPRSTWNPGSVNTLDISSTGYGGINSYLGWRVYADPSTTSMITFNEYVSHVGFSFWSGHVPTFKKRIWFLDDQNEFDIKSWLESEGDIPSESSISRHGAAIGQGRIAIGCGKRYHVSHQHIRLYEIVGDDVKLINIIRNPYGRLDSATTGSRWGSKIAIGSGRIVVGAPGNNAVHVYDLNGNGGHKLEFNYSQARSQMSYYISQSDFEFGQSVDIDSGRIVVGSKAGQLFIYDLNGKVLQQIDGSNDIRIAGSRIIRRAGTTFQVYNLNAPQNYHTEFNHSTGTSEVYGNLLATMNFTFQSIRSWHADNGILAIGIGGTEVKIYNLYDDNIPEVTTIDTYDTSGSFGGVYSEDRSIAISNKYIAIGSPYYDGPGKNNIGRVYTFEYPQQTLIHNIVSRMPARASSALQGYIPEDNLSMMLDSTDPDLAATGYWIDKVRPGTSNTRVFVPTSTAIIEQKDGVRSYAFDGNYHFESAGFWTTVDLQGDCTVLFWLYSENATVRKTLFEKAGINRTSYTSELAISWETDDSLHYYSQPRTANGGTASFPIGQWFLIAIRLSGNPLSRNGHYSINGQDFVPNWNDKADTETPVAGTIRIGSGWAGRINQGNIAMACAYNRQLTNYDIRQFYNATSRKFKRT